MKMKRILSALMVATLSISMLAGCGGKKEEEQKEEKKETIKISTTGNHAFFSETNEETGELQGYEIDVWTEISKRIGCDVEWVTAEFPGILELLDSGRVDTVADQIGRTKEREEKYNFSDVYFFVPYKIVVAEGNDSINTVEDLYGKKLGLLNDDIAYSYFDELDPDGKIEYVNYDDSKAVPADVDLGRIDATLMSALHIETVKKESGLKIKGVGEPVYSEEAAYPFQKNEKGEELSKKVNEALKEMKDEGFLSKTAIKWFGFDPMAE